MKSLSQFLLLALLFTSCKQQTPTPQDVQFLAAGERAIVGSYSLGGRTVGEEFACTLEVLTNHIFVISSLPVAGPSNTISVTGNWSLAIYRVFDARRYTVSFAGVTNIVKVRFPNADLPEGTQPTALSVWWEARHGQPVDYLFRQIAKTTPLPPPK